MANSRRSKKPLNSTYGWINHPRISEHQGMRPWPLERFKKYYNWIDRICGGSKQEAARLASLYEARFIKRRELRPVHQRQQMRSFMCEGMVHGLLASYAWKGPGHPLACRKQFRRWEYHYEDQWEKIADPAGKVAPARRMAVQDILPCSRCGPAPHLYPFTLIQETNFRLNVRNN